ncbi:MAG: hypothetical protein JST89_03905 [Cyanobacteria bacterium SZAS-4]|nr:hypothetical protein [Cyanobacteria bacterium SZAS-4]
MRMSKLYSVSLGLITALSCTIGQAMAQSVSIPAVPNTGATGTPAECGSGQAFFQSTSGMPLVTRLATSSSESINFAGLITLAPNSAADPTNLSTLLPIPYQGNFTQYQTIINPANQGAFAVQTYVAYSYVNGNGVTKYGVSPVPTQQFQQTTNQGLKGKSATIIYVSNTDLVGQRASLQNLIGNNTPGNQATNLTLLGIGSGIFSNGGAVVDTSFNNFSLNSTVTSAFPAVTGGTNIPVGKNLDNGANLNCNTFIPGGSGAATVR